MIQYDDSVWGLIESELGYPLDKVHKHFEIPYWYISRDLL